MEQPDRLPRKLAAILYADVAGYSRLTGEDEDTTHRQLSEYLNLIADEVARHGGHVMHYAGDAVLAMFDAVVDALLCVAHIQRSLETRNADLPDDQKVLFRIGVNLGDVIEDRGDIYGDGVNVAARLESLAEPGGICISESVHTAVGEKLPLTYEDLGEQEVKNIAKPVRAYRAQIKPDVELPAPAASPRKRMRSLYLASTLAVVMVVVGGLLAWLQPWQPQEKPASMERMTFPLPDEPSIAVLPFDNMSGDPEQDYLADGLSENIIGTLASVPHLFVIARNSSFTYKGKPVQVSRVAEELGVRYVLEGSVQKSGNRLRVTAQLIDAITGFHVWSKRYDRDLNDLFAVQDEITQEIMVELQVQLTEGEQARLKYGSTGDLDAWVLLARAEKAFFRYTKADNATSRTLLEEAVQIDPEYAHAWSFLAWTHWIDMRFGFSESPEESFESAVQIAGKAESVEPNFANTQALLGSIHLAQRQFDEALAKGRRSIELSPNNALSYTVLAFTTYFVGDWPQTIELFQQAMRLSPYYPSWWLLYLGRAQTYNGDYEAAISTHNKGLTLAEGPDMRSGFHNGLAFAYMEAGDERQARKHAAETLKLNPDYSTAQAKKDHRFHKNAADLERRLNALRKAGLPE